MGLVNRVVPAASLRDDVMSLAQGIAQNAPLTVVASKAAIREACRSPDRRDMARVEAMIEACFRSDDYREGQRAFAETAPARLHRAVSSRRARSGFHQASRRRRYGRANACSRMNRGTAGT